MKLRHNAGIIAIIIIFLLANAAFLVFYNDVWWDSSVYIGMGKYMFSLGESGLWEESRPLVLPFILGLGWKLGFSLIYFGRTVSMIFAALVLLMTYLIGTRLFSRKIGLMAAFFTAFSYSFLFFSPNILTEIPSTFFMLLAFYFFIRERFFLTGAFSGLALMTRFFQAFTLIGLALTIFCHIKKRNFSKRILYFLAGILIIVLPYLLLNYYLYSDILLPFRVQAHLTKTTGWMLYNENLFYFKGLLKENFFILSLLALPFFFRKNHRFYALALVPLIYISVFSFVRHKEMRFMIQVLPFLYLLASYCLVQLYGRIKWKKPVIGLFFIMALLWLGITSSLLKSSIAYSQQRNDKALAFFQNYLNENQGNIWITNPLYALHSDAKIQGLLYFYSSENLAEFIDRNKEDVEIVLFNECDMPCNPEDALCLKSRSMLKSLLPQFRKIYEKNIESCNYRIYAKAT